MVGPVLATAGLLVLFCVYMLDLTSIVGILSLPPLKLQMCGS